MEDEFVIRRNHLGPLLYVYLGDGFWLDDRFQIFHDPSLGGTVLDDVAYGDAEILI